MIFAEDWMNSPCDTPSSLQQVKYKEGLKQKIQSSLYHQLPETTETQLVKQLSELQSEVQGWTFNITYRSAQKVKPKRFCCRFVYDRGAWSDKSPRHAVHF